MTLTQSMEDYLEAIYEIDRTKRAVRVKDVADKLGVTMPSVNGALKNLESKGLIRHEKYEYIELTSEGEVRASRIFSRHQTLTRFLVDILGVETSTAEAEACKIEHVLSRETMQKIRSFMESFEPGE